MQAVDLTETASDEVSRMRLSDFGRHREAEAAARLPVAADIHHKTRADSACSLTVDAAKVIVRFQRGSKFHGAPFPA